MIARLLKLRVGSDRGLAHFCQVVCAVVAGLVMVFGFRRLTALELNEAQLFSACLQTLLVTGVFVVVGFQCRAWRRAG